MTLTVSPRALGMATATVLMAAVVGCGSSGATAHTGDLAVRIAELPAGASGDVTVTGPGGFRRPVRETTTLRGLTPGRYQVTAAPVSGGGNRYYASPDALAVHVEAAKTTTALADYVDDVPHTTKVLDPNKLGLRSDPAASTLVFAADAPAVAVLHPGDVLVVGPGPLTRHGLIRKVVAVHPSQGTVGVDTDPATLHDAMPRGRLVLHRDLAPRTVIGGGPGRSAGAIDRSTNGIQWRLSYGQSACAGGGQLDAPQIGFGVTPSVDFEVDWGFFSPNRVKFALGVDEHADLSFSSRALFTCRAERQEPDPPFELDTIPVPVGPIEVPVTPTFTLKGTLRGTLTDGSGFAVNQSLHAQAGVQWQDGNLTGIHDFSKSFQVQRLDPAGFTVQLAAGPELALKVFDLAGPFGNEQVGVRTDSNQDTTTGYGGLYFSAGVRLSFLGFKLEYALPNLISLEQPIFHLNATPATTTTGPTTSGPTPTVGPTTTTGPTPTVSPTTTTVGPTTTGPIATTSTTAAPPTSASGCTNPLSLADAAAAVQAQTGPYGPWVPDTKSYDPSLDLSAVRGDTPGGTGSSPVQVFLFHRGCYVGPAIPQPNYFNIEISQAGSDTVAVHFGHYQPADGTCCPSLPDYVVRYQWNGTEAAPLDPIPPLGQGLPY